MSRPGVPPRLRTVSLRTRVTVFSMLVLAAVLLLVTVLTDVLFAAQTHAEMRGQLLLRAQLANQLMAQGVPASDLVDRIAVPGIDVVIRTPSGTVYADRAGPPGPPPFDAGPPRHRAAPGPPVDARRGGSGGRPSPGDDQRLTQQLADGSALDLVASGAPVSGARALLRRVLIGLSVVALLVAGGAMLLTTRIALAPLDAMTAVARSITGGDRGRRLAPTRTNTELGRTAAAFDAMLDELEGAEAAARASEARTRRFVADAAHELRTPIAGVRAVAEAAIAPGMAPEDRERLHLLLIRESRRAGRLVEDLLVLARLDAGLELRSEPVDLLELAGTEAERARLLAPGQAVTVHGETAWVRGDTARLGQVLGNLLDNARRYADGTPVTVAVTGGDRVTVRVSDEGPGVPPADRERIFDRLVRLDEARGEDGGAGLGLAIARGIARAHGGDLRCVDAGGTPGAVFELTLPAQSASGGEALRT